MNKIAQKMLQHKKGIVALFAVLAVLCALLSRRVKVDYNMMHYLPKDAPSTIALDVMEEEYSAKTANCRIMIEDAAIPEALALKKQLQQVPGVSEVMWMITPMFTRRWRRWTPTQWKAGTRRETCCSPAMWMRMTCTVI